VGGAGEKHLPDALHRAKSWLGLGGWARGETRRRIRQVRRLGSGKDDVKQIIETYLEMADREALAALGFIVLFPLALLVWALNRLAQLTKEKRESAGRWLIRVALRVLPHRSVVKEQTVALLRDRRKYERYIGWCDLARTSPLSFDDWRRESAWVKWAQNKMRVA
jgi:hypothetical protein